jgi:hypothetical protein
MFSNFVVLLKDDDEVKRVGENDMIIELAS